MRFDSKGNAIWHVIWSGNETDIGYGIFVTSDDKIYICGYTESFGSVNGDIVVIVYEIPLIASSVSTVGESVYIGHIIALVVIFALVPIIVTFIVRRKNLS